MASDLYEKDFALWSAKQAQAIRQAASARINTPAPIDWENVAEEIETLGRSERAALRSRLQTIIEHLIKLQTSPAPLPRADWANTIRTQRREIEDLLSDSPSLRREVSGIITAAIPRLRKQVAATLADYGEKPAIDLNQLTYTEDQVVGDWFPGARDT
jgi:polyhydroxyalkanoate synthesis regulator phasin